MDKSIHRFHDLFAQLGLPCDALSIQQFIASHTPLAADTGLADATFWTPAQTAFLQDALIEDADWALLVDQLSEALRGPGGNAVNLP